MKRNLAYYLILTPVLTLADVLLAKYGAIHPVEFGIAGIYFAVPFMIVFGLWFGIPGAIAAYLGCFIGAGLWNNVPVLVGLYWSLADLWQVIIPIAAFKALRADIGLISRRDFMIFILFGVLVNNGIGAAWGSVSFAIGGMIPWSEILGTFAGWLVGNIVLTFVISGLLLKFVTPLIKRAGLATQNYWV